MYSPPTNIKQNKTKQNKSVYTDFKGKYTVLTLEFFIKNKFYNNVSLFLFTGA